MTFTKIPVSVEFETPQEIFATSETELYVFSIWCKNYPETRTDPGEEEGYEINSMSLVSTPDLRSYLHPSASICIYLNGTPYYCETAPDYSGGKYVAIDHTVHEKLSDAVKEWMTDYHESQKQDAQEQQAEWRRNES